MAPSPRVLAPLLALATTFLSPLGTQGARAAQSAAQPDAPAPTRLVVGVFDAPPFSEPGPDGTRWGGESIRLFTAAAERMGVELEFRAGHEQEILDAVALGEIDACASPIAASPARRLAMEFSHPFASSGLAVAIHDRTSLLGGLEAIIRGLVAPPQRHLAILIGVFIVLAAVVLWSVERRRNVQFSGDVRRGLGSSLWWSVVTLSTVGYGDKVPTSVAGRVVAAGWMLTSLVLTTLLTATIVSAVTVGSLTSQQINSASELSGIRVVAVRGSAAAEWLAANELPYVSAPSIAVAADMLDKGKAQALVAPRSELALELRNRPEIALAPVRLTHEFVSFVFRSGLPRDFIRRFDAALLELRTGGTAHSDVVPVSVQIQPEPKDTRKP
jgi:ABC-type amino acid transport substrate-binding protein